MVSIKISSVRTSWSVFTFPKIISLNEVDPFLTCEFDASYAALGGGGSMLVTIDKVTSVKEKVNIYASTFIIHQISAVRRRVVVLAQPRNSKSRNKAERDYIQSDPIFLFLLKIHFKLLFGQRQAFFIIDQFEIMRS